MIFIKHPYLYKPNVDAQIVNVGKRQVNLNLCAIEFALRVLAFQPSQWKDSLKMRELKMMKLLLSILCFSLCAQAFGNVKIMGPRFIKVKKSYQYSVIFEEPSGAGVDITNDCRFYSSSLQIRPGAFVEAKISTNSTHYLATLQATCQTIDNHYYSASLSINVDSAPTFIQIRGPYQLVKSTGWNYRAYGFFNGFQEDITSYGRWSARRGTVSNYGSYRAPHNAGPEYLQFYYGSKQEILNIMITE